MFFFEKNKLPILLLVITFSPYVFTAVRFDHILLIFLSMLLLLRRIPIISISVFSILMMMYVVIIISTFFHLTEGSVLSPISPILDSFEWYLRGAIIILFVSGMKNLSSQDIITISKVYIFSCVFIASIAVLQALQIDSYLLKKFLSFYAPGREGERMLYSISGRYSSILGQPVSYGIFFLFGISMLLFYGDRIIYSRIIRYVMFLFIFFSSFLSISKVILIGIPILILSRIILALTFFVKLRLEDYLCLFLLFLVGLFINSDSNIFAAEHLYNNYKNFTAIFDIINHAFRARFVTTDFGYEGLIVADWSVFKDNLLFGVGWTQADRVVKLGDSGYVPILVRSGILGMFFYMVYLLSIFGTSFFSLKKNFGPKDPVVMNYLFLFFISSIFAIGTPIFYIDRSSDFFWMLSAIAIAIIKKKMPNTAYKD